MRGPKTIFVRINIGPPPTDSTDIRWPRTYSMSLKLERPCPVCGTQPTFYRVASTLLHLGKKVKWRCPVCEYGFVTIGSDIDTRVTY